VFYCHSRFNQSVAVANFVSIATSVQCLHVLFCCMPRLTSSQPAKGVSSHTHRRLLQLLGPFAPPQRFASCATCSRRARPPPAACNSVAAASLHAATGPYMQAYRAPRAPRNDSAQSEHCMYSSNNSAADTNLSSSEHRLYSIQSVCVSFACIALTMEQQIRCSTSVHRIHSIFSS
jgi:hypothetical protein